MFRMGGRKKKNFVKSKDFLSQIPDWEKEYKGSDLPYINYTREDWIKGDAVFTDTHLIACVRGSVI